MSFKANSSNCSLIDDSSENSVIAKLRRLKIEENLLITNINKINQKETGEDNTELPVLCSLELKNYIGKLKDSLTEIKNMFGDLKAMTQEQLTSVDIENMKRDVTKLDERIRKIKRYVQSEIASETAKEKELTKQMNDVEERQSKCSFKPKTKIMPFNHIVPSPVKAMIQSSLKCKEVQNFQEFLMSSPNRFGGWNEYHHNVFVQIWQKHYKCDEQIVLNYLNDAEDCSIRNHKQFQEFRTDVLEKISGSTIDDIETHCKWYCKYLYLKQQQQNALNKWKRNKRMLSKSKQKYDNVSDKERLWELSDTSKQCEERSTSIEIEEELQEIYQDAEEIANALCDITIQDRGSLSEAETNISRGNRSRHSRLPVKRNRRSLNDILKPTKQWINRCNSLNERNVERYNDLEIINKLRIPYWRLHLLE